MTWKPNPNRVAASSPNHSGPVALYRLFNVIVGKAGEPFRLCASCAVLQTVPNTCILEKMADNAVGECQGANA